MRHEIQRTIAGALLATLTLLANGIATAEGPHERVRGEYRLTLTRTCAVEGPELIVPPGPGGTRTGIGGGGITGPFILRGTIHYDGTGEGTFVGQHSFTPALGRSGRALRPARGMKSSSTKPQ